MKWDRIVRLFLIIGALYLTVDGLIHLFDIRLIDVQNTWSNSALTYAKLIDHVYASFVFFGVITALVIQSDVKKYKAIIKFGAIWAIFHAILLIYTTLTVNFSESFQNQLSLIVWMPYYNIYLFGEAGLLILYAIVVKIWLKK